MLRDPFLFSRLSLRVLFFQFLALGFASLVVGCASKSPEVPNSSTENGEIRSARFDGSEIAKIKVVATVGMVGDLVRIVGDDRIDLTQICGSGVDPHLYKATRDDVRRLMDADMVFYSGLFLEGKLTDTLHKLSRTKSVFAVTGKLSPDQLLVESTGTAAAKQHADPHVWLDPQLWSSALDVIVEELSKAEPDHTNDFELRGGALKAEIAALHAYGREVIQTVPELRRILITSHDAFSYFGRAYGLEVEGVQGLSTESEAGLRRINELVDLIVEREVKSVFVESSVPRKSIESLIEGVRSRGHTVSIAEKGLFSDAMGPEGTYEGTYIGMLDHNLTIIADALGGQAPERGFQGKLSP